jgi:hypothetical protein
VVSGVVDESPEHLDRALIDDVRAWCVCGARMPLDGQCRHPITRQRQCQRQPRWARAHDQDGNPDVNAIRVGIDHDAPPRCAHRVDLSHRHYPVEVSRTQRGSGLTPTHSNTTTTLRQQFSEIFPKYRQVAARPRWAPHTGPVRARPLIQEPGRRHGVRDIEVRSRVPACPSGVAGGGWSRASGRVATRDDSSPGLR